MKGGEVREPYAQSALAAGKGTYVTLDNFKEIKMTEQKKGVHEIWKMAFCGLSLHLLVSRSFLPLSLDILLTLEGITQMPC